MSNMYAKLPNMQGLTSFSLQVFYFKAGYINGEITFSDKVKDFKWVTIEELKDLIHPETYDNIEDFFVEY